MPEEIASYPDNNPKTAIGISKAPLHTIPPVSLVHLGLAMEDGKKKYGLMNWRAKTVSASVYYDAMLRHLLAWWDGEDAAPDSKVHHLGHVMACCAILLDAEASTRLNDDRPDVEGGVGELLERVRQSRSLLELLKQSVEKGEPPTAQDAKRAFLDALARGQGKNLDGSERRETNDDAKRAVEGEDFPDWKEINLKTGVIDPHPIERAPIRSAATSGIRRFGQ
jgi:hypothetical protein